MEVVSGEDASGKDVGGEVIASEANEVNLKRLAEYGVLDEEALKQGLKIIEVLPGQRKWFDFLGLILQVLGSLFLISGIFFFFAFNWANMHKFAKLGLLAFGLIAVTGVAFWRRLDRVSGKVALTAAALLAGALLAVYGQIYQTGADSYQLFLLWAVLIVGWVAIGRFSPLWVFWVLLLNLSVIFYWTQIIGWSDARMYLALFLLNGAALLIFEIACMRGTKWLQNRWVPRLLSLPMFAALVIPATTFVTQSWRLDSDSLYMVSTVLFVLISAATLLIYSRLLLDPFILLVCAGGLIWVSNAFILANFDFETWVLLLTSILILVEAAAIAFWLRHLTQVQGGEAQ